MRGGLIRVSVTAILGSFCYGGQAEGVGTFACLVHQSPCERPFTVASWPRGAPTKDARSLPPRGVQQCSAFELLIELREQASIPLVTLQSESGSLVVFASLLEMRKQVRLDISRGT